MNLDSLSQVWGPVHSLATVRVLSENPRLEATTQTKSRLCLA